jgi:hypothetical protein
MARHRYIYTLCLASWICLGMQPFLSPLGVKVQSLNSGCAVLGIFRGLYLVSHVGYVLLQGDTVRQGETGFDKATTPIPSSHDYFQITSKLIFTSQPTVLSHELNYYGWDDER